MNFVYSIAMLSPMGADSADLEFVSVSEDRSLKVWSRGECVQTITHPCISVWSVCVLANGDIVSGSRYVTSPSFLEHAKSIEGVSLYRISRTESVRASPFKHFICMSSCM